MEVEIKSLVEQSIQAQIVRAFHDAPEAIDALVKAALSTEVDDMGMKPDFHSKRRMPYLEFLVGDTIRRVARSAVTEAIEAREDEIREAVKRAVSTDAVVEGLMQTILGSLKEDYRVNVQFADERD